MAGPVLHVEGTALIVLRVIFVLLGVTAATIILVLYFRKRKREGSTKNVQGNTELDTLLRDAEKKLASAQRTGAKTLDSLPLLYMLGESNAAKTTVVMKSGLDPELLAGQMYRDQEIVATSVANLWYTQQCVIVEAGDAVRKSPGLWAKLIRRTRPKAYRAAMGTQAPIRAAVVCMSCEHFLGTAATDAVAASARQTNQMLRDLAQLGTEVPVYVILTKLDRVPPASQNTFAIFRMKRLRRHWVFRRRGAGFQAASMRNKQLLKLQMRSNQLIFLARRVPAGDAFA